LAGDIKVRDLQVPIVLIREDGKDLLVDGISRLDAIESLGIALVDAKGGLDHTLGLTAGPRVRTVIGEDPFELAASLNAHRRHLTPEQRRALERWVEYLDRLLTGRTATVMQLHA
jgi:hypothetical protein